MLNVIFVRNHLLKFPILAMKTKTIMNSNLKNNIKIFRMSKFEI